MSFLTVPIFLFWPHVRFGMLCVLSVLLLFALREAFKLEPVKREAVLLVPIRPFFHFSYFFLFFAHRLLLFLESRQKRF